MIKIMIVDDEDYIRQGMHFSIPWESNDMEVVGEAGNGADALSLALKLRPDIILTDIQMPLMNGLELAQKINELIPDTRVIILTAYGNTDNLSLAIHVKVSAFLLKSADSSQILETVLTVKKEAETIKENSSQVAMLKDVYVENRHLLKATLVSRFLQNQISFSYFVKKADQIHLYFSSSSYCILEIYTNGEDENLVINTLSYHLQSYKPFVFFLDDKKAIAILDTDNHPFEKEEIDEYLPLLLPMIFGNCFAIFSNITNIEEFPIAFTMLGQVLEQCFWKEDCKYTLVHPEDNIIEPSLFSSYELESTFIKSLLSQNENRIKETLLEYYNEMKDKQASRSVFLESVKRILVILSSLDKTGENISQLIHAVDEVESAREVFDLLFSLALPSADTAPIQTHITPALEYISNHYMEDIYLEDVAKSVFLSTGYLSRIFKSQTGYSFKEYLHRKRILKAQELVASSSYKYYEIAEMVGYKDYKYFSAYFNKITGCSAKEYRLKNACTYSPQ